MKYSRAVLVVLAAVSALFTHPQLARASCNIIPDGGHYQPDPGGPFTPYKGALGRIDHVYLIPGYTKEFTVVPDRTCVGTDGKATALPGTFPKELGDVITVAVHGVGAADTVHVRIYAPDDVCAQRERIEEQLQALSAPQGPHVHIAACNDDGVRFLGDSGLASGLRLPVVTAAELHKPEAGDPSKMPSDTVERVVVMRKPDGVPAIASAIGKALASDCSNACPTAPGAGLLVCVDKLYAQVEDADGGGMQFMQDPTTCNLDGLVFEKNNYKTQCEVNDDDTTDPQLTRCAEGTATTLGVTLDSCGNVHIPFDWSALRANAEDPDDPNGIDRFVSGVSATGDKKKTDGNAIRLPGREFLASTPFSDPPGDKTNPRKPDIDVDNRLPEQMRLVGTVDSDNSIIHMYPRMFVSQKCSNGEACYSADPVNGNGTDCACRDREGMNCSCTPVNPKKVFACDDGPFKAMPCTRPQHCNPGGRCIAQPRCRSKHDVWAPGARFNGKRCWDDDACGPGQQCGYLMFDLSELDDEGHGKATIDARIHNNGRKRRGVCEGNGAPCNNENAEPDCPIDKHCRGYVLHSGPRF
jgi:hypothetical protein